jgi:phenylacetate-CoA ligase
MTSLRATLFRLYWEARSRASPFGLTTAIRFLEQSQWWERARLDELRDRKLRLLVEQAYAQSPHYRRMMDERAVRPTDVRGLADLPKLPILTKDVLRQHGEALRFRGSIPVETGATGGTTGNPIHMVRDRAGTVWQRGCYWRGLGFGGMRLGEPYVQIFGGSMGLPTGPLDHARKWFMGKRFLSAFGLGPASADRYLEAIRASKARFLVGYASALFLLARHAERGGLRLRIDAVFPTAELLPEAWRATLARAFGAPVLPYYGCGEVQSLGYSCPADPETYHTCDEHSVIEVETPGGASLEGEGPFLLTDLDNHALPLLRYRNGDAGALEPPGCRCGRSLGRIVRLDGRVNDLLYTTRGEPVCGTIGPHAFRTVENVEQFQIVQTCPGQIVIRIVPAPGYLPAAAEQTLEGIFRRYLGQDARVEFEYLNAIPPTAAGKARFVICEAPPA